MKTIAKNRMEAIETIFAAVTTCRVYSDNNYYEGRFCDKSHARKALSQFRNAKLVQKSENSYAVNVDGGLWYEMSTAKSHPHCYCGSMDGYIQKCDFCSGLRQTCGDFQCPDCKPTYDSPWSVQ